MRTNRRSSNLLKQIKRCMAFLLIIVGINYGAFASKTTCQEGKYLPKGGDEEGDCVQCPAKMGKFVCEKKKHDDGEAKNADQYSLKVCNKNEKVNSDRKCEKADDGDKYCAPGRVFYYNAFYDCSESKLKEILSELKEDQESWVKSKNKKKMWDWIQDTVSDNKDGATDDKDILEYNAVEFSLIEPKDIMRWYCKGFNGFKPSTDFAYGLAKCPDGKIANEYFTGCQDTALASDAQVMDLKEGAKIDIKNLTLSKPVTCGVGYYFPDKKTVKSIVDDGVARGYSSVGLCKKCNFSTKVGYNCPSVTVSVVKDDMQGYEKCAPGQSGTDANPGVCQDVGTIDCKKGEYLPVGKTWCASCEGVNQLHGPNAVAIGVENFYCEGKTGLRYDSVNDQGLSNCYDGVPNAKRTACEDIVCKAGEYLPAGKKKCESCKGKSASSFKGVSGSLENFYCPGTGRFRVNTSQDQGVDVCKDGKVSDNRDGCKAYVVCEKGKYHDGSKCVPCANGGTFEKDARENRLYCSGKRQGKSDDSYDYLTECPNPKVAVPNKDLSDCECLFGGSIGSCNNKLDKKYLKYGPAGNENLPLAKHCWTKMDDKDYKKCMGL